MSEARTGKRFPLELPIRIREDGAPQPKKGTTANVSAAGVYIRANGKFTMGSKVQFEITLPGEIIGSKGDVSIQCRGRVVRLDDEEGKGGSGMACVIDHYKFVRK